MGFKLKITIIFCSLILSISYTLIAQEITQETKPATVDTPPTTPPTGPTSPFIKFFPERGRIGMTLGDDGLPLRFEKYNFSQEEIKKSDDIVFVKTLLKRELHRLTKIFFNEHPSLVTYNKTARKALFEKTISDLDEGIDKAQTMAELAVFSFENFRSHLLRISAYINLVKNNPPDGGSLMSKAIPREPYDYVALVSLVLGIALIFRQNSIS